jgi:hypothetical protein
MEKQGNQIKVHSKKILVITDLGDLDEVCE